MPELTIRPMTLTEYDRWRAVAIQTHAREQVAAGNWPAATALERARADNDELLPDGFATENMLFCTGELPGRGPVGLLWLGLTHPLGVPDCGFLYEIEVFRAHRRQGHGKFLLRAAEDIIRDRGLHNLELNVLGGNTGAIHMYDKAGYTVSTQRMRKSLRRWNILG
jgi:ribosomal protein S18 acetylase RimI-like enzyme